MLSVREPDTRGHFMWDSMPANVQNSQSRVSKWTRKGWDRLFTR